MALYGVSFVISYVAWDTVNNVGKTGDVANHTLRLVIDGTSGAPTNTPTEVDATNAPGLYKLTVTATEAQALYLSLAGKSSTSGVAIIPVQVSFEKLPNVVAGANGGLPTVDGSNLIAGIQGTKNQLDDLNDLSSAQVNTEVDAGITDARLDHLLLNAVVGADVTDNSVIAKLVSKSGTADWDSYTNTTDSLEAIRDKETDIETDTQDIQGRIPAALVSGKIDASVGAYASGLTPLQPTVAGRTLDVNAGGEAGIDLDNTSGTLVKGTDITGFNDLSAAQVNAEVDTALDTAIPGSPTANSVNERIKTLDDNYTTVRAGLIDNIDATVSSRASQTSVDTLDDFVDTEVGAIKTKTDQLTFSGSDVVATLDGETVNLSSTSETQIDTIETNTTTLLNRLGAFTGSGVNTVLGFFKALLSKDASTPSDVGGTFSALTDALEALRDNHPANFSAFSLDGSGDVRVRAINTGAITDASIGADVSRYSMLQTYVKDDTNSKDSWAVQFLKDAQPITSGVTGTPTLTVKAVGSTLIDEETLILFNSEVGAYYYDETTNRTSGGILYISVVTATIDGSARTFKRFLWRDAEEA